MLETGAPSPSPRGPIRFFHDLENALATSALGIMALLPLLEVLVRKLYPSGIPGSALWVQHLALWLGFLGAAIAARRGELLSLTIPGPRGAALRGIFTAGVGFAVSLVLVHGSLELVSVEREGGRTLAFGLPVWVAQSIMPLGFALIGWRLLWRASPTWRGRLVSASFGLVPILLGSSDARSESSLYLPLALAVLVATALGAPIFVGLGGVAAVLLWHDLFPVSAIPTETYGLSVKPILPTIPLFTLAGYILAEGGTPRRLVELFRTLVGFLPGGVAVVAIVVCAFFTSFTGGSGVTILAMGGLLFPMLIAERYSPRFSTGLLTSAGSLGLLFPPSLAVILYGLVAEVELRRLFLSGLAPAVLEIALVAALALVAARKASVDRVPFDVGRSLAALWQAKWEVGIPLVVLGSILGGLATPTEAAAMGALGALCLVLAYRRLSWQAFRSAMLKTLQTSSMVLYLIAAANYFGAVFSILGTPFMITEALLGLGLSAPMLLLLLLALIFVLGWPLDWAPIVLIFVPVMFPVVAALKIDMVWFGTLVAVCLQTAWLTPPMALSAYFLKGVMPEWDLRDISWGMLQFLGLQILGLLLVVVFPQIALWLPGVLYSR